MISTPRGNRLHIGIFGRRNVGKSSLLNALTRQEVSIVSDKPGTTTDPVHKAMELLPIGPVLFIDTAGIDDVSELGEMRVHRTRQIFDRTDVGIIVTQSDLWDEYEDNILSELTERKVPAIVVFNKVDIIQPDNLLINKIKEQDIQVVKTVANKGEGILDLRDVLIKVAPEEFITPPSIIGDLIKAGDLVVLVVPIDLEAPKGRLILPQVQTIRDILDNDAYCIVVKETRLGESLNRLAQPPALVITDSQAIQKVASETPDTIKMTSFSIIYSRYKGDFAEFIRGTISIDSLKPGDRVLISEACTHHPIGDDIGRVKIPNWLSKYVGGNLNFSYVQGHDFPEDLNQYKLVIHCGACMLNRREVLSRIIKCKKANVPITNYGMTIAYSLGIFERAIAPFPSAIETYRKFRQSNFKK